MPGLYRRFGYRHLPGADPCTDYPRMRKNVEHVWEGERNHHTLGASRKDWQGYHPGRNPRAKAEIGEIQQMIDKAKKESYTKAIKILGKIPESNERNLPFMSRRQRCHHVTITQHTQEESP